MSRFVQRIQKHGKIWKVILFSEQRWYFGTWAFGGTRVTIKHFKSFLLQFGLRVFHLALTEMLYMTLPV